MLKIFIKYTGNKKFGLYSNYRDWTMVSRAKSEDDAVGKIQRFSKLFKGFEFKFE